MFNDSRLIVIIVPLGLLLLAVVSSFVDLRAFLDVLTAINDWILQTFSSVFAWVALISVIVSAVVFVSPLGRVRIGGADAEPVLSLWNWFAITLCTTIAVGILFWATTEPIYHFYAPGNDSITPGSAEAAAFARVSLLMHWSITPYAIYAVPSLAFALAYHNYRKPCSLSAPLSVLLSRPIPRSVADVIDAIAVYALVAGMIASLGAGILSIGGGVAKLTGLGTTPVIFAFVAIAIVSAFIVSSVTGLQRGIRFLSDINAKVFFVFVAFIFLFGPSMDLMSNGVQALGQYVREFVPRSVGDPGITEAAWFQSWTVFYWANWLAWAPITAMFLGRIARGHTVRAFLLVNLLIPAFFSIVWMSVFGGVALQIEQQDLGSLKQVLDNVGPEAILYTIIERYPASLLITVILVFLMFISFVTAADSNIDAIAAVSRKEQGGDENMSTPAKLHIKVLWGCLIGFTAWIMINFSGLDGIRMMSNLGGLPALLILLAMNLTLLVMLWRDRGSLAGR